MAALFTPLALGPVTARSRVIMPPHTSAIGNLWGTEDEEIALGGGVEQLAAGLDRRGYRHASFPGYDHEGMLSHLGEALPAILSWFDELRFGLAS